MTDNLKSSAAKTGDITFRFISDDMASALSTVWKDVEKLFLPVFRIQTCWLKD